jgi:hypothetical protein
MTATLQQLLIVAGAAYREEWRPYEHDAGRLVFLVGCQRSGTTWLHLQLAHSGSFRFLNADHVNDNPGGALVHNYRLDLADEAQDAFEASPVGAADVLAAYEARREALAPFSERFGYSGKPSA